MTKEELIAELKKEHYKKKYTDVFVAAYNLALEHAAEGCIVSHEVGGKWNEKECILALKITE